MNFTFIIYPFDYGYNLNFDYQKNDNGQTITLIISPLTCNLSRRDAYGITHNLQHKLNNTNLP